LLPTSRIEIFGLISCAGECEWLAARLDWRSRDRPATPKQPAMSKQKIGWSLVALAFALVLILVRYATLYWLEVLVVPIVGLVALGLAWGLSE
jgi:hypothetical protein